MKHEEINEKLSNLRDYFRNEIKKGNFQSKITERRVLLLNVNNFLFFFEKVGDIFLQTNNTIDLDISFNEEFDQILMNEYEKCQENNTYREAI